MHHVLIGQSSGATIDAVMDVYPRHKIVVDTFIERGSIIGIGRFGDGGNMAIFRTREDAEHFAAQDPFILEGLISSFTIREWHDAMLT